ncbi:MAG: ATP-binding cassette domain-containing protein [Rickettsiales bacterium]|nr:ATP-binding cassette domain-containing protein [Rickettsiales bacterium]
MGNTLLRIKNLEYILPHSNQKALDNISLDVEDGDFIVIIGHNGSGKSSLINAINKNITSSKGEIIFNSKRIESFSNKEYFRSIATITQNLKECLFERLSVYENFLMRFEKSYPKNNERFFYDMTTHYYEKMMYMKDVMVSRLSGGEKQILALILALINPPKLLLLDEHTSALDPKMADYVMDMTVSAIKEHKMACIMVTHDLNNAVKYGNKIYALKDGKICYYSDKSDGISKDELLKHCF